MAQAAVTAARTVGYVGAGTVEFLVDPAQQFYFMEMNTRLQVEHPVTELITGIDLVQWQLEVACGGHLPGGAAAIAPQGAAIEARLYAEDPAHEYLPSVGRIAHLRWPGEAGNALRLDVGVDAGDEVTPFYDPMLGKLIARGESRAQAIDTLHRALAELEIAGVKTNRALLQSVLADAEFRAGGVTTSFLQTRRADLSFGEPQPAAVDYILAALWYASARADPGALWADTSGWRLGTPAVTRRRFGEHAVDLERLSGQEYRVRFADEDYEVRVIARDERALEAEIRGSRELARIVASDAGLEIFRTGRHTSLTPLSTDDALQPTSEADAGTLVTPLPGTVVAVHVRTGQSVERGAPLITVEAMKMEHTVAAPYAGTVERMPFGLGDRVAAGSVLAELKPRD
jgi:3-methylcrotonyl-CoA carboxylase alpha subunit